MSDKEVIYRYSLAFRQKLVSEIEEGKFKIYEAARIYDLSPQSIYNWLRQLGKNHLIKKVVRVEMKGEADRMRQLEKEKQQLESALAQAHLKIMALESLVEVAGDHYGVNLKKNFGIPPSKGVLKDKQRK